MQWWMLGAASNGVIAVAYFMISFTITRGLLKSGQLATNRLGAATAAIFLSCAVHHGAHMVHMLMPYFGVDEHQGMAMREAWGPELAFWDLLSAFIGVYYWTLRGGFGSVGAAPGPQLFADQHEREQRALELNDAVLQGMVVARMALDLGERERALKALRAPSPRRPPSRASHLWQARPRDPRGWARGRARGSAAGRDRRRHT